MIESTDSALTKELLEVQRTLGWMDLVIGNISDAVYVVDEDSRLVFANQVFANLLQTQRVFLLGMKLEDVFKIRPINNPQTEFIAEENLLEKNNESGLRIYDWSGPNSQKIFKIADQYIPTIRQTVSIAKDITTEYEQSVIKSNFINIASHQLRTPMTAIMTYAHMLRDGYAGSLDTSQDKLVETIINSSQRMIMLINDILLITRIQEGEANLKDQDTTMGKLLTSLETEVLPACTAKNITLDSKYSAGSLSVGCNQFIHHEILSNLLTNAIQYTPDGGTIFVRTTLIKGQLTITIRDTGIGIPADYIPKIFDQFARASNAFELFNNGTGLGLYVVKMLLGQVDGNITCKSQLNKGTTFTVTYEI